MSSCFCFFVGETTANLFCFCQTKIKQLEQEAHLAAGQQFLVTSNTQLRTVCFSCITFLLIFQSSEVYMASLSLCMYVQSVCAHFCVHLFFQYSNLCLKVLFEKLRLHDRCENKKLPKTVNKQQQSTSEAAV